jgi:hypothetical protein
MKELEMRLREEARHQRWREMRARYRSHEDFDRMQLVLTR